MPIRMEQICFGHGRSPGRLWGETNRNAPRLTLPDNGKIHIVGIVKQFDNLTPLWYNKAVINGQPHAEQESEEA